MVLKHSRQRDSIKEFLMGRKDHPTASVVYDNVRRSFPNISLGTVTGILLYWQTLEKYPEFMSATVWITLMRIPRPITILSAGNAAASETLTWQALILTRWPPGILTAR